MCPIKYILRFGLSYLSAPLNIILSNDASYFIGYTRDLLVNELNYNVLPPVRDKQLLSGHVSEFHLFLYKWVL